MNRINSHGIDVVMACQKAARQADQMTRLAGWMGRQYAERWWHIFHREFLAITEP